MNATFSETEESKAVLIFRSQIPASDSVLSSEIWEGAWAVAGSWRGRSR